MNKEKRVATTRETADLYPEVPYYSLRGYLDKRDSNGLDACVIKRDNKIVIDLDKYEVWLEDIKRYKQDMRDKEKARRDKKYRADVFSRLV